jgi:hypothetical protein
VWRNRLPRFPRLCGLPGNPVAFQRQLPPARQNSCSKREVSHRAVIADTYTAQPQTAHASNSKGLIVYFIVIQVVATAALLVAHFAVIVKNQLTRTR